jgi:hypothetical protein
VACDVLRCGTKTLNRLVDRWQRKDSSVREQRDVGRAWEAVGSGGGGQRRK